MPARRPARDQPAEQPADPPEQQDASQLEKEDSNGSSEASSASELLSDPGPEFDPDQAAQDADARDQDRLLSAHPGGEAGVVVEWEEQTIRSLLEAVGAGAHGLAGKAEHDWEFTRLELTAIGKPLTRILNRYDATRVAAATGDEIALILGLIGYLMRSLQERAKALKAQQALEEQDAPPIPQPPIQEPFQ